MSVTESPVFLHARQRRLNVIRTTKRHLGLETWTPAAVPADLLLLRDNRSRASSPSPSTPGRHPGPTLISSPGIKTNIFSWNRIWTRGWYQECHDSEPGCCIPARLQRAAVSLLEALIRLLWQQVLSELHYTNALRYGCYVLLQPNNQICANNVVHKKMRTVQENKRCTAEFLRALFFWWQIFISY